MRMDIVVIVEQKRMSVHNINVGFKKGVKNGFNKF